MNRFRVCVRALQMTALLWLPSAAAAAGLGAPPLAREGMTAALQRLWTMPPSGAAREAAELRSVHAGATGEERRAAGLLLAVALERAGDRRGAAEAYRAVLAEGLATPHAVSARARLRGLEGLDESGTSKELYAQVSREPEAKGWFVVVDRWEWTDARRAAFASHLPSQSGDLSDRLLGLLHARSFFPKAYAYLFVFLALSLGIKVLALPLHVEAARFAAKLPGIAPQIGILQSQHADDPSELKRQMGLFWRRYGVKPWSPFAVSLVDLIFVVWALETLDDFWPQLALDGARFGWASNLAMPDFRIGLLWLGACLLEGRAALRQMGGGGRLFMGIIFVCGVFFWPAYLLIFWGLLNLLGVVLNAVLTPIFARAG